MYAMDVLLLIAIAIGVIVAMLAMKSWRLGIETPPARPLPPRRAF